MCNPGNNPHEIQTELVQKYKDGEFYSIVHDSAITTMKKYAANAFKDIDANIGHLDGFVRSRGSISEVVIMGHTLMGIDDSYYDRVIVPLCGNCVRTIYVHGSEDESRVNTGIR